MSLVKILGAVDEIISIKTHLKGAFGLSGILDLAFLFIEAIWHDVQKGSGSILSSTSSQIFAVSPVKNYLVDLCPNLWCSNSKAIFFLAGNFFFYFSIIFPRRKCFLCAHHVKFLQWTKRLGLKFYWSQRHPSSGFLWIYFHQQHPNVWLVTQLFLTTF